MGGLGIARTSFALTLTLCPFLACSPGEGGGAPDNQDEGGSSGVAGTPASGAGATTNGGTAGAGATTNGGNSGTGFGGSAGAPPQGGASGVSGASGAATGGAAGLGGAGGDGMGGTVGGAGSGPGGASGSGPGAYTGTIIVQDNFDTSTSGMPPNSTTWEPSMAGDQNPPAIDNMRSHTPPNSARAQSTSSGRGSFLVPRMGLPVAGNSFYVRVFMNWEKATTAITGHSGFIVGSAARENNGTEVRLGISSKGPNNVPRLDLNLQSPSDGMGGEVTRYSNGFTDGGNPGDFPGIGFQFAADRWYCVEAYFKGTMGAAEFRVWVDGTEIMEMHVTDFRGNTTGGTPRINWAPTYSFLKIGAQDYDANLGRIWYDDVFVGTAPVGCQR